MKSPRRKIAVFTDKFPLIGPVVWILSVQYFVAQIVAAAAWPAGYNWAANYISDLGNTVCGLHAGRYVCSPDHGLMNASFIMLGVTMAVGSLLIYQEFKESKASLAGFSLMALAGIGTLLVGAFPENTIVWLHVVGALLALGVGNVSLIILALALRRVRRALRIYTFLSGIISLVAFTLFATGWYPFSLQPGATERIASYPQTFWLILFGLYMCASHVRAKKQI